MQSSMNSSDRLLAAELSTELNGEYWNHELNQIWKAILPIEKGFAVSGKPSC